MNRCIFGLSLILSACIFTPSVWGECSDGPCLRGVSITKKGGQKIDGYIRWEKKWFKENSSFPSHFIDESKFAPHYLGNTFSVFKDPIPVPYLNGTFVFAGSEDRVDLNIHDVKEIKRLSMKDSDLSGEGQEISEFKASLIKNKKPVAHLDYSYEVCSGIILSYDPSYSQKVLDELVFDPHMSHPKICSSKDIVCLETCVE